MTDLIQLAIDWQYLTIKAGGMARKSDCEDWLMKRTPGLTRGDAHEITNAIEGGARCYTCCPSGVEWHAENAGREEPRAETYPDTVFGK